MSTSITPTGAETERGVLSRFVALNVFGHAGGLAIAFVTSICLARLLGPSDRGLLAILLLASSLPVALGSFGLPITMSYFASRDTTPRGTVLGHSIAYAAVLAAVFVPVCVLLGPPLSDLLAQGQGVDSWPLVGVLIPATFLSFTTVNHLWGRLDMALGNILTIASKVVHLFVVLAAIGLLGAGVNGGLVASLAAAGLIVAVGLPVLLRDGAPRFHWPTAKAMLRYGSLAQIGTISLLLNARLDILVLSSFLPLSDVGHYVVATTVAEIVIIVATGFQGSLIPLMARQDRAEQAATTISAFVHHGILALAAIIVVALIGPVLILVAFGPTFADALLPMLVLLPGMWFLGVGTMAAGDLQGRGKPGLASSLALLAAALTIGLDILLIPRLGTTGAALASVLAYTGFGVASLGVLARLTGVPWRVLVLPTRADLALYPDAFRAARARIAMRLSPGARR